MDIAPDTEYDGYILLHLMRESIVDQIAGWHRLSLTIHQFPKGSSMLPLVGRTFPFDPAISYISHITNGFLEVVQSAWRCVVACSENTLSIFQL